MCLLLILCFLTGKICLFGCLDAGTVHVYPGPTSNVVSMQSRTPLSSAFFMPEEMRSDVQARNEIANLIDTNLNQGKLDRNRHVLNR